MALKDVEPKELKLKSTCKIQANKIKIEINSQGNIWNLAVGNNLFLHIHQHLSLVEKTSSIHIDFFGPYLLS